MDKPFHALDDHFRLPQIRRVESTRAKVWLQRGWQDMRDNLAASLTYGVLFALAGALLLFATTDRPYLFTAAISGFFLVGPLAAAGVYEISRRHDAGESTGFFESLRGLRGHADQLAFFGAFLAFALIAWERLSAILFALFYDGSVSGVGGFASEVLLSTAYLDFVAIYVLIGGAVAALVFSLSVVAVPMLMDRDSDIVTATMTSMRAVAANQRAMLLWAAIIVGLVLAGFATLMIGMVVVLPLLGHASWHAYRDLVE
ncbi:MAG: DUF2189 domain-containing protein [Azoarcus sp.]|nr:DUF2189 domain-containing protein [Azoarcus sp.]